MLSPFGTRTILHNGPDNSRGDRDPKKQCDNTRSFLPPTARRATPRFPIAHASSSVIVAARHSSDDYDCFSGSPTWNDMTRNFGGCRGSCLLKFDRQKAETSATSNKVKYVKFACATAWRLAQGLRP